MRLDLDDLSLDELDFVTWLLRICYKCEKEIPITETKYGYLRKCGCIRHTNCLSARIREGHQYSNCSLDLKRTIAGRFLKNQDLSTAILQKLRDDCSILLFALDSTENAHETLNNKEIVLLIRIFKICYKCGNKINGTNWSRLPCGCIYHSSNCPSPQNRPSHPNSCSYEFRAETVEMYKNSINSNFGEFFRTYMTDNYPNLMKDICSNNQIPVPTTQIERLRQELDNAKKEILEANNEKNSLREELVKANQAVHATKKKNKSLQHDLEQANQALNNAKNEHRLTLETSKQMLANAESEKEMLRLLNEDLKKNLESTKNQFESANMRLAVITDEINNLRRQSDAARNELPVEEQKVKQFEDEEIVASDKSLLNFEWKKFAEQFVDLQEKTERLVHETVTARNVSVMVANNPKILKASQSADQVKNHIIETLRTETTWIAETQEEIFPSTPQAVIDDLSTDLSDAKFLD